jgi:hypothetical protein
MGIYLLTHEEQILRWALNMRRLFLGRDQVCDLVILRLRDDSPGQQLSGFIVGTIGHYAVCLRRSYAWKAEQLLLIGSIQIERLVAAPSFAYAGGHSLGVSLHFLGCPSSLLF